jgi:formylglycine-generating enzyme required for sulfatase activity
MNCNRFINLFSIVLLVNLLCSCGNHNTEDDEGQFSDGATIQLTGTANKNKIELNDTVQIIATTRNGKNIPQYFAVSSRQEIANVAANDQIITIIGIKVGKTKIIVIDDANGRALGEFDIEVLDPSIAIPDPDTGGGVVEPPPPEVNENEIGPIGAEVSVTLGAEILNFKSIPYGRFLIGDHNRSGKAEALPIHSVTLTTPFWISEFEITNEQYLEFLNDSETSVKLKDGIVKGDYNHDGVDEVWLKIKPASLGYIESNLSVLPANKNYPIIDVSWYGAMAYCRWLSANQTGTYRLPTNAEWEFAVRGSQTNDVGIITYSRYPWGLDFYEDVYANVFGKSGIDTYTSAGPINQFVLGKTLYGLQDTIGNVAEWCYDTFENYDVFDKTDPFGPETSGPKVYRGGSWGDPSSQLSVSNRSGLDPTNTSPTIGFRIVRFVNGTDPIGVHASVSTK